VRRSPSTGSDGPSAADDPGRAESGNALAAGADRSDLHKLLFTHPDLLDEDALLWADGRTIAGDRGGRTLVGWHRCGGGILLGVTAGEVTDADFVETLHLARLVSGWTVAKWSEALASYWRRAPEPLADLVVGRWGLGGGSIENARAWGEAAWGDRPAPGPVHVGVLGATMGDRVRGAVTWLRDGGVEVAGFVVRRIEASDDGIPRIERVAGGWHAAPRRPLPAAEEVPAPRGGARRPRGGLADTLVAALEQRCLEAGGRVVWKGEEWVRMRGPERSLRVFPGPGRVDLQFTGADEGTLTGLRFRFAVPLVVEPPSGAPPGVHLRLAGMEDLTPNLDALLEAWWGDRWGGEGRREGSPVRDPRPRPGPGRDRARPER